MEFIIDGRCPTKGSTRSLNEPDMSRVLDYMRGVLRDHDSSQIVAFVHEGAPVSKARARWSRKGHFYTPDTTQGAEEALAWRFREVVKGRPWKGNVALAAVFFRPNHQRIDADNLMKLVLDAGTKAGVWDDDCQVTHQIAVIEKDAAKPRTVIALSAVSGSLDRSETTEAACVSTMRCGIYEGPGR